MSRSIPDPHEHVKQLLILDCKRLQLSLFTPDGVVGLVTRGSKNPLWFGLAGRLKRAREHADLPAQTIGNMAGVAHQATTRLEREESVPGIDLVEKIAIALGIPPCWLAFGVDGEEPFQQKVARLVRPTGEPMPVPGQEPAPLACTGCGERLRVARTAGGLSMRDVGRAAEVSVQAISLIELGRVCPKVDTCERIAVALDVAPCWLAYGVGRGPVVN
jgi:transcriptional regulator with XRE-family HTH domain